MRDRLMEVLFDSELFNGADGKADANSLADHLLANSVILPPCKVGDTVFMITPGGKIYETVVIGIRISGNIETRMSFLCPCALVLYDTDIGKTVFLTREEAEQALKGEHHAEIH